MRHSPFLACYADTMAAQPKPASKVPLVSSEGIGTRGRTALAAGEGASEPRPAAADVSAAPASSSSTRVNTRGATSRKLTSAASEAMEAHDMSAGSGWNGSQGSVSAASAASVKAASALSRSQTGAATGTKAAVSASSAGVGPSGGGNGSALARSKSLAPASSMGGVKAATKVPSVIAATADHAADETDAADHGRAPSKKAAAAKAAPASSAAPAVAAPVSTNHAKAAGGAGAVEEPKTASKKPKQPTGVEFRAALENEAREKRGDVRQSSVASGNKMKVKQTAAMLDAEAADALARAEAEKALAGEEEHEREGLEDETEGDEEGSDSGDSEYKQPDKGTGAADSDPDWEGSEEDPDDAFIQRKIKFYKKDAQFCANKGRKTQALKNMARYEAMWRERHPSSTAPSAAKKAMPQSKGKGKEAETTGS